MNIMEPKDDPQNEGHTREWQDRARIVLDAKEAAKTEASPNQSPASPKEIEDVEEKSENLKDKNQKNDQTY
jgi:hypothetical protein